MKKKPIHFHMSYDAQGSVLKKNVVVHSNQRAYVIHGTHNVTLEENVAFDVFGMYYIYIFRFQKLQPCKTVYDCILISNILFFMLIM